MNRPTHKQALWAGLGILILVNAIALGGAAWNRSAQDSRVVLSERELRAPYLWQDNSEDSGAALWLSWRARPATGSDETAYLSAYSSYGANPSWLDAGKLRELGFDLTAPPKDAKDRDWRQHERRAILVLELDGPAYAQSVALAAKAAAEAKAKSEAAPTDESLKSRAKDAADALHDEQTRTSRLFAVDAGLDHSRIRAKYPDRQRYLLVSAVVQMAWHRDEHQQWRADGSIQRLMAPQVHLSRAQAQALAPALSRAGASLYSDTPGIPIAVELAFGRRLEPWVLSARVR